MGEYKTISITNVSLSEEDWQYVIRRLNLLATFVRINQDKVIYFGGLSTKKLTYSVDCSAITTEYNAFRLDVNFYIGPHLNGVRIEEMK